MPTAPRAGGEQLAHLLLLRPSRMPVSALVLTTDSLFTPQQQHRLANDPRVTLGERTGSYLPVVTETATAREARDLAEGFLLVPGVADAQLVSWSDDEPEEARHGA